MPDYGADPQVVPYLLYENAGAAMDWLIRVLASPSEHATGKATGACGTANC
jgi:hypothetical protein